VTVKKILHVIPSVGPLRGGPSEMVRGLARRLACEGIETHVATTDDNGPETLDVPRGVPVAEDGVTYWYFPRQTRFYTFSWPLGAWLKQHVSEFDVLHIHALFSFATLPAAFWASRYNVPYIVRPLGTLSEWGMKNRRPWLKGLSFRLLERRILEHAALVHYTSDQERVEAEKLNLTASSAVIPNGLSDSTRTCATGQFREARPMLKGRRLILFLSRLDPKKGLDLLLRAFARIRRNMPDIALVLAGEGDPEFVTALKNEAASLGIASDVHWPGFLTGTEKEAALADADLYVLPSYSENFGIAVVEAMAAGLPVIVSDQVGIHPEIARARAGLVVSCDVGELADGMTRLLDNPLLRRAMAVEGRSLVHYSYSATAVTRKLIDVYNEICAGQGHQATAEA
jgi:glycosyltransferase involved in cell wall biosynthesis